jgi:hypothetical protein
VRAIVHDACDRQIYENNSPLNVVWKTCTIPETKVGYFANTVWCPSNNCWKWLDASLVQGIQLPTDARNISIKALQAFVDDWSPQIKINGNKLIWKDDPTDTPSGWHTLNKDISAWLKGGANLVYVGSYNKHTYWSIFFEISGSYQTQGTCSHSVKYQHRNDWQ